LGRGKNHGCSAVATQDGCLRPRNELLPSRIEIRKSEGRRGVGTAICEFHLSRARWGPERATDGEASAAQGREGYKSQESEQDLRPDADL
jgi:hypothetical protein